MISSHIPRYKVKRYVLPSDAVFLHQRNSPSRIFCIGVWLKVGSRDEKRGEEGLCHFLEHMLFKGTSKRNAYEISQALEKVGGSIDAFTTREQLCIYAQALNKHKQLAIDLLSDMLLNYTFPRQEFKLEKKVVLEEIRDAMDSPEDSVYDLFNAAVFPGHPFGKPILGRLSTVSRFSRSKLVEFAKRTIRGSSMVISVCGDTGAGEARTACETAFRLPLGVPRVNRVKLDNESPRHKHVDRHIHQQHIILGNRAYSYNNEKRFALLVLTTLLGGGMSSRLFQRIREKEALAYNVFCYTDSGRDTGLVGTYMSVKPENAHKATDLTIAEFEKIARGELSEEELRDTKEHLKGRILLGLETTSSKMMRMARNEIYFGRQVSEGELIGKINRVGRDEVIGVAMELLSPEKITKVSLGPKGH